MRRRAFLAATSALTASVAGCTDEDTAEPTADTTPTEPPTATDPPTATRSPTATATATPDPYDPEIARENAISPTYDELFRNINQYKGDPVRFGWAQVYQVLYGDEYDHIQMYVSNNDQEFEGDVAAEWYGDQRILEDDRFQPVVGVAERLYEYETVQGDTRTIPLLTLVDYELFDTTPAEA